MFEKKDTLNQFQTSLAVSYMEIYKDEVYDLLVTRENVRISISLLDMPCSHGYNRRQSCLYEKTIVAWCSSPIFPRSPSLASTTSIAFTSESYSKYRISALTDLSAATKHRSVGATNLNRASSRSHAVLTIEATMLDPVANTSKACFLASVLLTHVLHQF